MLLHHLPKLYTEPFFRNGFYAVDLFFILSGFILYHVHGDELRRRDWIQAKRFYALRFWRVYPLHVSVIAVVAVLVALLPEKIPTTGNAFSSAGLIQTLLLLNGVNLPNLGTWNGPSWSLSSEALAYALFPLLVPICARTGNRSLLYGFVASALTLHCVAMYTGHEGVPRVLLAFPAGMALAQIARLSARPVRMAGISVAFICVTLAIDALAPLSVFGFAGLILSLAWNEGAVARLLSSRLAMFLGAISFSLYLTHELVFQFVGWIAGEQWSSPALAALALAIGWVTYKLIEAPSHRYARKVKDTLGAPVIGDAAVPDPVRPL